MTQVSPDRLWWTADEIASARLLDMPSTRRGVNKLADRNGWREQINFARRRAGNGGGWEYHWTLLPLRAQKALLAARTVSAPAPVADEARTRDQVWAEFDGLPQATKARAQARLEILRNVEALETGGITRDLAVSQIARLSKVSARTIWNWFSLVEGVRRDDRLAYLAPQHRLAKRASVKSGCDAEYWSYLKSAYLRLEAPTFAESHRIASRVAKENGWQTLSYATAWRRIQAEVPRVTQIFAREGLSGLEKCFPPQIRDRTGMVAMEGANADCHKIDVFVRWPDGKVNRPQIIAFQDLYSGKMLSWRVDHDPNKVMVMAAFGEMIETYGIPKHVLFDNGREFANKWLTGGTPTRFRFKVRDDDPLGVLPMMGIKVHWATPAHGQAKPIERAFGDFASNIAKDPRFAGAYVGNRPDAKPENYGSTAIEYELFLEVLAERIDEHNARLGRRSPTCCGRSFDATFAESYARVPITKATAEQQRLWLMGQEVRPLAKGHGRMELMKNLYSAPWMAEHAGEKVVARFDPEDLHAGSHIYRLDGSYLGYAPCQVKIGFFDVTEARQHSRNKRRYVKAQKELLASERALDAGAVAAALPRPEGSPGVALISKVVSGKFGVAKPVAPSPVSAPQITASPRSAEDIAAQHALIDFEEKRRAQVAQAAPDTARERFRQALVLEEMIAEGRRITDDEMRRLHIYQSTPEYGVYRDLLESHGWEMMFGTDAG